jgi:hypothetical protein
MDLLLCALTERGATDTLAELTAAVLSGVLSAW